MAQGFEELIHITGHIMASVIVLHSHNFSRNFSVFLVVLVLVVVVLVVVVVVLVVVVVEVVPPSSGLYGGEVIRTSQKSEPTRGKSVA
jgi:hypothetical protein